MTIKIGVNNDFKVKLQNFFIFHIFHITLMNIVLKEKCFRQNL